MPKYTPGPWVLVENSWDISTVYAPSGETIAQCPISGLADEETQAEFEAIMQANALAISLLPELVEALREVLSWWPEGSEKLPALTKGTAFEGDIQRARALLAKIDGDEA